MASTTEQNYQNKIWWRLCKLTFSGCPLDYRLTNLKICEYPIMISENVNVPFLTFSHQAQPYLRFLSVLSFERISIYGSVQLEPNHSLKASEKTNRDFDIVMVHIIWNTVPYHSTQIYQAGQKVLDNLVSH